MNAALTRKVLTLVGLFALTVSTLPATTYTWSGTTGSDWNTAANWGGTKPTATDIAVFSTNITSVANAVADQNVLTIQFSTSSVGSITLGSTSGNKLTLGNGGSLSIISGVVGTTTETINAPLVLAPTTGTGNIAYTFSNAATVTTATMVVGGAVSAGTTTGSAVLTLAGDNTGANTISGLISDGGATGGLSVVKTTKGKWVLSNANNSFTGGISINSGTVSTNSLGVTGNNSAFGTNGTIKVGSQGSTTLLYTGAGESSDKSILLQGLNGLGLYSSGTGAITISGNISSTTATATNNNLQIRGTAGTVSAPNVLSGVISEGTGALSIIKGDANTWALTGANTYTGTTTINGGTVLVGNGGTTGQLGTGNVINPSGTLGFNRTDTFTVANVITGIGAVQQLGTGTTTLTGASTYTGNTTITAGTLSVATIGNGGVTSGNLGSATNAAANLVFNGGALQYTGADDSTDRSFTINTGKTAIFDISTNNLTISGASTSTTGGLTKIGSGILTLSGTNLHTGITTITAGTLSVATIGNGGTSGNLGKASNAATNLVFDGGTLQYTGATASTDRNFTINTGKTATFDVSVNNLTISGNSTATTGGLAKIGSGTLILSGVNLYTGGTSVSNGTLRLSGTDRLSPSSPITVSGGIFNLGGGSQTTTATVTLSGGTIQNGTLTQNGGLFDVQSGTSASSLSGTGALTKSTSGTVTLSVNNGYTGATTLSGGTLVVNGSIAASSGLAMADSTSLSGTGTVGAVSLAGHNSLSSTGTLTSGTLTVGGAGNTLSSGVLTGLASVSSGADFTIAPTATLGSASITGLLTNNGTISGLVTVNSGGMLKGSGLFSNDVTISSGGTLSPGNSPGLQTFSTNVTLGGTTLMEISGTDRGTTYDALNVGGTLTYGGALQVTFGSTVSDGSSFSLFTALDGSSAPTGSGTFDSVVFEGSGYDATLVNSAGIWRAYNLDGHDFAFNEVTGALSIAASIPVPEPATYALLAGAVALLGAVVRRRRIRANT